jgi:hypothetical protein
MSHTIADLGIPAAPGNKCSSFDSDPFADANGTSTGSEKILFFLVVRAANQFLFFFRQQLRDRCPFDPITSRLKKLAIALDIQHDDRARGWVHVCGGLSLA